MDSNGQGIIMKPQDATADMLLISLEAMPKSQRKIVLQHLFSDPALKEDLIDAARWYERRTEPQMPYEKIRQKLKKTGRL
jgi:hypothetical protein